MRTVRCWRNMLHNSLLPSVFSFIQLETPNFCFMEIAKTLHQNSHHISPANHNFEGFIMTRTQLLINSASILARDCSKIFIIITAIIIIIATAITNPLFNPTLLTNRRRRRCLPFRNEASQPATATQQRRIFRGMRIKPRRLQPEHTMAAIVQIIFTK